MNIICLNFLGTKLEEEMNEYRGQSVPRVKSQNMCLGIKFGPFLNLNTPPRSRDRVVGIATCYGLDD
jgi:hypothetical protein